MLRQLFLTIVASGLILTTKAQESDAHLPRQDVANELDSMDQAVSALQQRLRTFFSQNIRSGPEVDTLASQVGRYRYNNGIRMAQLLDKYGWLGKNDIGEAGATSLFRILQQADPRTQEKYLPLLREAVKKGAAAPQRLAVLEDNLRKNDNKPQIYGTLIQNDPETGKKSFYPIEDEANVNARRASMGLPGIEEYARKMGVDYKRPQ